MSDTYGAQETEGFDPVTYILGQQRAATGTAISSLNDNPDDAARAMELSKANGVPAPVVNGDLDHYEQQTKAAITANLLNSNSYLRDYAASHPLAAKVSNDDWGALDQASESIKKAFGKSVLHAAFEGFAKGYGSGPPGSYLDYPKTPEEAQAHPAAGAVGALVALAGTIPEQTFRVGGGIISAGAGALAQAWANLTGGDAGDFKDKALQALSDPGLLASLGPLGATAEGVMAQAAELHHAATVIEPWAREGKVPPVGVHPIVDKALADQAKEDAANLKAALKDSGATATLERSKDLFANHFVSQITDAEVGISADALRKVYGSKIPGPGDGILGDSIPDLGAKLASAEATGGDVKIKAGELLANPDVAKELIDNVRMREGGLTVEEAKNLPPIEAYHGSPYEFDAFSSEKIGTGEGAQSYGHGLYFAEAPEVAESYRPNLEDVAGAIKGDKTGAEIRQGPLYKVHIHANKEDFLDWDKDLSEQPGILSKITPELRDELEGMLDEGGQSADLDVHGGRHLYQLLNKKWEDPQAASEHLRDLGIPGIKYLDQGSRNAADAVAKSSHPGDLIVPKPTSNFVLFDPSLVEITHRNGEAIRAVRQAAGLEPIKAEAEAKPTTAAKQLELPAAGTTRIEDRDAFAKAAAIGMTVDQYKRYQGLIEKRAAEDTEAASARAVADQRKRQTTEWKANRAELRPEVKADVEARPEVELDAMLQDGRVKLAADSLTPEQLASIPPEYVARDGIHPDDLAGLFGASDSADLLNRLNALTQARAASGMKPKAFLARLIEAETDARMEAKYGSLEKNVLEEAKDQVLSETQEQLLHEQVLARASEAGLEYSIGKEELKASIKGFFDRQLTKDVSSDRFLADAGKAGRAERDALLKNDAAEAFRQAQRQYHAVIMANFARKFEKAQARFDRLAAKYKARELPGTEQEYTNWIHDLLVRVGKPVNRSIQDLQTELGRSEQKTLADFVVYKTNHDLREMPVEDFILDPNFKKNIPAMTTQEAQDFHDAIRAIDKNGRDERKYIREDEARDLNELKGELIESLQRFKEKEYGAGTQRVQSFASVRHAIRTTIVSHLQVETVFNRLDRFDPKGPWNQYVFRPLVEGANHEARLEREFGKRLGDIADDANLKEVLPNSIFTSPFNQAPLQMNRKNLRAVMLNTGNRSNLWKMAKGYGLEPQQVMDWVHQHATKEDWDWSQKVWDMLGDLGDRSAVMYRSLTGLAPEKLPIDPIQTPHGSYAGGYYPLIRHEIYGEDVKLAKNDLEGAGYVRATTAAGYTKKRTGAIYPVSLDLDALPNTIRQIIHDTAMRPAIIQAGKIFYDNKIKNEFKKHLGTEYADMFLPWLKDVANTQNYYAGKASKEFQQFSDFMRQNAVTTLVGFNPSTVMKHTPTAIASSLAEVGPKNLLRGVQALMTVNDETGTSNLRFMMQHSEEMQRRMRNWVETMGGGMQRLEGRTAGKAFAQGDYGAAALNLRDMVTQIASSPVALGDFMSSGPMWMGKYMEEMEDHGVHGDAVYAADKSVRQAHGSSAITSKSAVARSKALSWFTGFFTFFNDVFNRQVETVWRAGEAFDLAKEGRKAEAMSQAGKVAGRFMAYVVAPAMIEELVSPLTNKDKESWGLIAAKSLAFTLSSSWVFAREVVNGMLNSRDPSVGLLSTMYKSATDIKRDFSAVHVKPGNIIKHGSTLAGMLTGLVPAQVGRTAQFATSQEKPKGPWGWLVGARYGTLRGHSQTLDQWWKGK